MPKQPHDREIDSENPDVTTFQRLTELVVKNDRLHATYSYIQVIPGKGEHVTHTLTVERDLADAGQAANDWVSQCHQIMEPLREEEERGKSGELKQLQAEAAEWAAMTPEQQKDKVDAAERASIESEKNKAVTPP